MGKSLAKRHGGGKRRKIDPYAVTPNRSAIRTMRLRAGILGMQARCNPEIRADMQDHMKKLIDAVLVYTAHARRKRINAFDVKRAIVHLAEKGDAIRVYTDEPETIKKKTAAKVTIKKKKPAQPAGKKKAKAATTAAAAAAAAQ